mgnify:CR=1 FL=1
MALTIAPLLHGWDVTSVTVRYQVADAAGTLGDGASATKTLTGVIDAIEYEGEDTEEEISPLTSRYENSHAIATNDRLRLVEIASNSIAGNYLPGLKQNGVAGGEFAIFAFVRSGHSVTLTGTMGELRTSVRQGKSVHTLDLLMIDIYDTTPNPDEPAKNPVWV